MRKSKSLSIKYESIFNERSKNPNQSIADFCKQQGIKLWSFYYWKKKLNKPNGRSSARRNFIPLQVPFASTRGSDTTKHCYEIRFSNGSQISIVGKMEISELASVICSVAGILK
jgi:hypothetical protein